MNQPADNHRTVLVWDRGVRLFHWLLVLVIAATAVSGFLLDATWLAWHVATGLAATALVLARIAWGFLGSTHARFRDFLPTRESLIAHLKGRGHRHLGHNPLGALMVFALLATILTLAATGIAVLGGLLRVGPLAADLGTTAGAALREVHEVVAIALLVLIVLHVAGVMLESVRSRENLARSMLTGRKPVRTGDALPTPVRGQTMAALAIVGLLALVAVSGNAALSRRAVPGLPIATIPDIVTRECGDCHAPYHPSLLPAAAWTALLASLDDHYGEDASLDDSTAMAVRDALVAQAAETVDTRVARGVSRSLGDAEFTVTETRFWQRLHHALPDALITDAAGAPGNCEACHRDAASGRFSPFSIELP